MGRNEGLFEDVPTLFGKAAPTTLIWSFVASFLTVLFVSQIASFCCIGYFPILGHQSGFVFFLCVCVCFVLSFCDVSRGVVGGDF